MRSFFLFVLFIALAIWFVRYPLGIAHPRAHMRHPMVVEQIEESMIPEIPERSRRGRDHESPVVWHQQVTGYSLTNELAWADAKEKACAEVKNHLRLKHPLTPADIESLIVNHHEGPAVEPGDQPVENVSAAPGVKVTLDLEMKALQ